MNTKEKFSVAQVASWLMYHIVQSPAYNRVFPIWYDRDGEIGTISDVTNAAVALYALFEHLPEVKDDTDVYALYPEYAENLLSEYGSDLVPLNSSNALCKTLAKLAPPDEDPVEWKLEGEGLTFSSAWEAAHYFHRGQTLLAVVQADPEINAPVRTIVRVHWVDGQRPLWMIGAIELLAHYRKTGWWWERAVTPQIVEVLPKFLEGTNNAPLILLHAGVPYDGLVPSGVMVYLHEEVWACM